MIKCPYCQSELPDEALICPKCRSLLVESEKDELPRSKKLSFWGYLSHPWAALAYLVIGSLLVFQKPFSRLSASASKPAPVKVSETPRPNPQPEPDLESSPAPGTEETLGEPEIQAPENRGSRRDRDEMKDSRGKKSRGKRVAADVESYEQEVKKALASADQLVEKFNEVSRRNGKAGTSDLNDILGEVRDLLKSLRALQPPAGFERCHTTLSNSIALIRRGLRSKLLYLETGESSKLSEGQKDLDTARQQREEGLLLLESIKQDLASGKPIKPAPVPAAPPPEPAKPAEPSPRVAPPSPPPSPPPAEVAPPEPEPENGETLEPGVEPEGQPENVEPKPSDQDEEPY